MKNKLWIILILLVGSVCFANSAPVVRNVTSIQRKDGTGIVDISYTLSDADNDHCTITVVASDNGGSTWSITPSPSALSGDLTNVSPGSRHITWNSKLDLSGVFGNNYRVKVTADDGYFIPLVWVSINESGFNGQMSKYETTNAQYCQFLNAAKASGAITVSDNYVIGTSGPYSGQNYYHLAGAGYTGSGATNGGAARINYTGNSFTVDPGFENHPVTFVSWYGATAFCNYYGYRLPTRWEWQAVADYNGSYTYGCGTTINNSMANYGGSTHPDGTTVVGAFVTYGYGMCDMAGNVFEWTSTPDSGIYYFDCGGSWYDASQYCTISFSRRKPPIDNDWDLGFRVCR